MRKFFCANQAYQRRIFTERLPDVAAPWARRTLRLADSLLAVGVALDGRAGSRLTQRLQRPTPLASLLQVVRHAPLPQPPDLHAIGIDEWAWRRGYHYGAIVVDLETHRVVDLLPDRSSESAAQWLAQHPGITVVGRDRSDLYANGTTQGAPRAVLVVDRFHLAANLREAIARVANATFTIRRPEIWGEGATSCASDAKKFGAWDQNLMTEWHIRYGGRGVMICFSLLTET